MTKMTFGGNKTGYHQGRAKCRFGSVLEFRTIGNNIPQNYPQNIPELNASNNYRPGGKLYSVPVGIRIPIFVNSNAGVWNTNAV